MIDINIFIVVKEGILKTVTKGVLKKFHKLESFF